MQWSKILRRFFPFLFYHRCPLCRRFALQPLCQTCRPQVEACGILHPEYFWQDRPPLIVWGLYGGALKQTIAHLKYKNQPQLARPLGEWLAQSWLRYQKNLNQLSRSSSRQRLTSRSPIVVPIPLHQDKLKSRGFNQAALIAESFCRCTNLPLQVHGLERIRQTTPQFGLSSQERQENLTEAFRLGQDFRRHRPHRPILLVDDIYTTGATVEAAIAALKREHLSVLGIATVAVAGKKARSLPPTAADVS